MQRYWCRSRLRHTPAEKNNRPFDLTIDKNWSGLCLKTFRPHRSGDGGVLRRWG